MLICVKLYSWVTMAIWYCYLNCFRVRTLNCIKVWNIALTVYISALLLFNFPPRNSPFLTMFSPSRMVNMNSINVHLCSELVWWSPLTLFVVLLYYCYLLFIYSCFYVCVLRLLYVLPWRRLPVSVFHAINGLLTYLLTCLLATAAFSVTWIHYELFKRQLKTFLFWHWEYDVLWQLDMYNTSGVFFLAFLPPPASEGRANS